MIVVDAAVEELLQLHLDHRESVRLMQVDRFDGIEHHDVLKGYDNQIDKKSIEDNQKDLGWINN